MVPGWGQGRSLLRHPASDRSHPRQHVHHVAPPPLMRTWTVHTWAEVEAALRARPRWRRIGREWHGPCPVRGIGDNTCWFAEGNRTPVRGGCRKCGGRLLGSAFREHLDAICEQVSTPRPPSTSTSRYPPAPSGAVQPPSTAPGDVWARGVDPNHTPGWRYLVERRRVWSPDERLPPSVRWLPRSAAAGTAVRVPAPAAGALLYRFAAPGEAATMAVQWEAVDETGGRVLVIDGQKRAAVRGSTFDGGRRVFTAALGAPGRPWNCAEGPIDALAVRSLLALGLHRSILEGAEVVGTAGAGFLGRAAPPAGRPAWVWCQADGAGYRSAIAVCMRWRCECSIAPAEADWADVASAEWGERVDDMAERGAIRDE